MVKLAIFSAFAAMLAGSLRAESSLIPLPAGTRYSPRPLAVQQQSREYILPELILGGEWTSTIKIANLSNRVLPVTTAYFVDNLGNDLVASFQTTILLTNGTSVTGDPITSNGFTVTLNPGGIIEVTFSGGTSTKYGQVLFDFCSTTSNCLSSGIYAEVSLKNHNASRPDFESIFPLEQPATLQYMLWDSRKGNSNVLYLVNDNITGTVATLTFVDAGNNIIQAVNVNLVALGSQILSLETLVPSIIGKQGSLTIRASNSSGGLLCATTLRINPTNSFTPVRAFVPSP